MKDDQATKLKTSPLIANRRRSVKWRKETLKV